MPPNCSMLAQDIRGRYWRYGSRGWTFPPIFHYIFLLCDKWQQRGSLTKWHLIWECRWSKGVSLNSSMWKKWHPLTFIDACWTFVETKQWMWAQWGGGWCVSTVATAMWKTSCIPDAHVQLSHHKMKSILISSSVLISGLQPGNCVWSWILASVHWKWWWQCWNIAHFAPCGSHKGTERTLYESLSGPCESVQSWQFPGLHRYQ